MKHECSHCKNPVDESSYDDGSITECNCKHCGETTITFKVNPLQCPECGNRDTMHVAFHVVFDNTDNSIVEKRICNECGIIYRNHYNLIKQV